jgi:hypothetical protein
MHNVKYFGVRFLEISNVKTNSVYAARYCRTVSCHFKNVNKLVYKMIERLV